MTITLLSIFRDAGPPIANHLWQSTAFVAAIGLLTLLFARNRARIRCGLWLTASAKFLIPFSALMALGSVIPASNHAVPVLQPALVSAVHAVDQPFSAVTATQDADAQSFLQRAEAWLPAALVLIWALGFAAVLLAWYVRWRHAAKVLQRAVPAEDRREADILRRIENNTNARTRTRFLISSDLMEPGVFGIFRPVLLWPAQLSGRLEDAHLEAILAHEAAHVHRRDNLTALMHMAVEAIFWFHPFVWWIERRMLEERERACDEAVLQSGSRAEIYADSLLKVSRFCAELPLPCVSGFTGADLSKRIRSIMSHRFKDIGRGKRLLLAVLAMGAVAGPVAFGFMQKAPLIGQILQATGPLPSFEVATIKPSHSGPHGTTMANLTSAQLYGKAMKAMKRGCYGTARLDLETLLYAYPDSEYRMRAKLAVGDSWYREGGSAALMRAETEYNDFIIFFPDSPLVPRVKQKLREVRGALDARNLPAAAFSLPRPRMDGPLSACTS